MKFRLNKKYHMKILFTFIIAFISYVLFSNSFLKSNSNNILCNLDENSMYFEVLEDSLPFYNVKKTENKPYYSLNNGDITEAFDTQAVGAVQTGIAKYWYPHYLATVVIAVDRNQTDVTINSWNDLIKVNKKVAFFDTQGSLEMSLAAISYGLEGKDYSLEKSIELLNSLYKKGNLIFNSFDSPIIICFDYQATTLIDKGRNIEIILPKEGTFTYEKGLLSNKKLDFGSNFEALLLEKNFKTLDGTSKISVYPNESYYSKATKVKDYNHLAIITQNASCLMWRNVLHSKRFMSIDNREHLHFALIYLIIVTIWALSIVRRSMQKGIRYSALFTGIILNSWVFVRLIKYQNEVIPEITRYLWYSFYIFQLTLPLVLLWMAWAIDKPENQTIPPKWLRYMALFICLLIILVFTNDIHRLVFKLDLSSPDWGINYSYGFGYYIILFVCLLNILAVFLILLYKNFKNPKKMSFLFPLIILLLFVAYTYKYIMRDPFIYESDITIVTGLFTMLMFESCIHSGLIPVNTKYVQLFKYSPLKMQIISNDIKVIVTSITALPLNKNILEEVINSSPDPFIYDDYTYIFANEIPGGFAIWHEDIKKLYTLQEKIKNSTRMLTEANSMLAEEEKVKRIINKENAKKIVIEQLDSEISESIKKLSIMIDELQKFNNDSTEITCIALFMCYIKRRCNLFFLEKETNSILSQDLFKYLDELSEIARYSNLKVATLNNSKDILRIRNATLLYDFFHSIINLAIEKNCDTIIEYLEIDSKFVVMKFLLSRDLGTFEIDTKLKQSINKENGQIQIKNLDDMIGISITFPKGGVEFD